VVSLHLYIRQKIFCRLFFLSHQCYIPHLICRSLTSFIIFYEEYNLWRNLIRIFTSLTVILIRPPLWSNGQSSWLYIKRFGFDSRRYQIFSKLTALERGPLSLVSTIEELLGRNRKYGSRDPSRWPRVAIYPQKLALTLQTIGGRSVVVVRTKIQATVFFILKRTELLM
jgi:hypothetical protein